MNGKFMTAALAALAAAACGPQSNNVQRDAAVGQPVAPDRQPLIDTCAVARHPERFQGQRVRLRALVLQDLESVPLTSQHCMWRTWGGKVWIDTGRNWDFSAVGDAVMEASRRSTATRWFAAEAEFEGIVRAHRDAIASNETRPIPEFVALFEVDKVDRVRLVEIPAAQPAEVPVTEN